MENRKTFVLDTNVLLHNPQCLESFADNIVVLPMVVIEELDKFKTHTDELGRNSRKVIRALDFMRSKGKLGEGVETEQGGIVRIISAHTIKIETGLKAQNADNRILQVAFGLHKDGKNVIFVSKDINARIKADALGLVARDFERETVDLDELYTGCRKVTVSKQAVDDFYKNGNMEMEGYTAHANEFVVLEDETNPKHTALGRAVNGKLIHLRDNLNQAWQMKPRNREQRLALELLLDDSISVVTLVGQAGTGKTFLALAAALEKVSRQNVYDGVLVSRPIMPLGRDIGYLPGSKDDKLSNWMQPIFDNLTSLMRIASLDFKEKAEKRVEDLLKDGTVSLEALTYIRGRSISRQFMIVDEAQNLTPHEVKTIISRAGEETKVVLTGDPYQIDNPYLDSNSNGLTYAAERLKDDHLHGHITLRKSERSSLAALAAELL